MKNVSLSNGKEGIYIFSGMILGEDDINILERIVSGLGDRIRKLEKNAPAPEGTRLNVMEYSLDTFWKAQIKANKILEETQNDVLGMSKRLDLEREVGMRIYKTIDKNHNLIEKIVGILALENQAGTKRDKLILELEEVKKENKIPLEFKIKILENTLNVVLKSQMKTLGRLSQLEEYVEDL